MLVRVSHGAAAGRGQLDALRALTLDRFANFFRGSVTAFDRGSEDAERGVCMQAEAVCKFQLFAERFR